MTPLVTSINLYSIEGSKTTTTVVLYIQLIFPSIPNKHTRI